MAHLLSFILAVCPAHSHVELVSIHIAMSVIRVLCLVMVYQILSVGLDVEHFYRAHWCVSNFFTNDFVRDHV